MTRNRALALLPAPAAGPVQLPWSTVREQLSLGGETLRERGRVVILGPWGSGRTTLLQALAEQVRADGAVARTLWVTPRSGDRALPFSAVTQLLAALPPQETAALAGGQRAAVEGLLRRTGRPLPCPDPIAVRLALTALLRVERAGPVLLAVDGCQWLDEASADTFGHVLQALPPHLLKAVVTERSAGTGTGPAARTLCGDHVARLRMAPLTVEDVAGLLVRHGLSGRWAAHVHRHCGGHPLLVQAMADAIVEHPPRSQPPLPPPGRVQELAAMWLATLPADSRRTLATMALAEAPTARLLRRSGCPEVDAHLEEACEAGIVTNGPRGEVAFVAGALRDAAHRAGNRSTRLAAHRALAASAEDPVHAVRHELLALDAPDAEPARRGQEAAQWARDGGARALAAELLLLAVESTPVELREERLRRLTTSAGDAAAAGRGDLALRAADALAAARADAKDQVTALLAVVDAGGQAMVEMDEVLARARDLAGQDPALLGAVELRIAIRHNVCHGRPHLARLAAQRAALLARRGADPHLEAVALTMRARMERITGHPAASRTLARALASGVAAESVGIRHSPQYLAVRHAVFDDRLDRARTDLMHLLPVAERTGDAEDLEEVLRSLAEVDARAGDCGRALGWGARAMEVCVRAGLSLGPAWYTTALTEAAGGGFHRAAEQARLGALVSREEHDLVFTSRNLLVLGTVQLVTGDVARAVETLTEVARLEGDQEVHDLTMLRWQPEVIEALASAARPDEARHLLERLRAAADDRVLATGLGGAVARSEAVCRAALGATDEAVELLEGAAAHFRALNLPVEEGRTYLTQGRVERGRRRHAAARTLWQRATLVFESAGAHPWTAMTTELLQRLEGTCARTDTPAGLTEAEHHVAAMVAAGASNQDVARRLFLSVKTVEATLSRVYRKLDIRSRTQLTTALQPMV
ncbi:LuxR C-terminal-related transcriptional regulator [Streptomyces sp. A5-4]|uniref:helix-turn-helix transcriptional regulator n=1 Tax=Streptomyces sp. A5-4 TaxID=3384771 RepID=UPI003DA839DC